MKKTGERRGTAVDGLGYLLAGAVALALASPAAADTPNLNELKNDVLAAANSAGWRDTIYTRVPSGQSCVESSEDRARTIANYLQGLRDDGKFGAYQATVGTKSGYDAGLGSMHTFTVVEIKDARGRTVATWEVDNYLGKGSIIESGFVDWDDADIMARVARVESRPTVPKPPKPPVPTPTVKPPPSSRTPPPSSRH